MKKRRGTSSQPWRQCPSHCWDAHKTTRWHSPNVFLWLLRMLLGERHQLLALPPRTASSRATHPAQGHMCWWTVCEGKGLVISAQLSITQKSPSDWTSHVAGCRCHVSYTMPGHFPLPNSTFNREKHCVIIEHVKFQGSKCGKFTYIYTNHTTVFKTQTSGSNHCKWLWTWSWRFYIISQTLRQGC